MSGGYRPRSFGRGGGREEDFEIRLPPYVVSGICLQDHAVVANDLPKNLAPELEAAAIILHLREVDASPQVSTDAVCCAIPAAIVPMLIEMLQRWQLNHDQHLHARYVSESEFVISDGDGLH